MNFNPTTPQIMHIDINSCFATIEQQANPLLRGKPIVIGAYTSPRGCVLAASIEAKKLGIKTGMRVMDARKIYPKVVVLPPDPPKYRHVHLALKKMVASYTNDFCPKSIDEFCLDLKDYSTIHKISLWNIAEEIKERIKGEIGEWITVSIGIAPNRYLAKIGAGIKKPDGLVEINKDNFEEIYKDLKITDLTGIKNANSARLASVGIYTVLDFYNAPIWKLKIAFRSITSLYWHQRLHGYEIDDFLIKRKSFGNSIALGINVVKKEDFAPILSNLVDKTAGRLRVSGYKAGGVHLGILYKDGSFWHQGRNFRRYIFDTRDIFLEAMKLTRYVEFTKPIRNIAFSVFDLSNTKCLQLEIFDDVSKNQSLMEAIDTLNGCYGDFVVKSGVILKNKQKILDRIAFGGVREL